jgi:hypothetical protein
MAKDLEEEKPNKIFSFEQRKDRMYKIKNLEQSQTNLLMDIENLFKEKQQIMNSLIIHLLH